MAKVKLPSSTILFRVACHKDGTVSGSHLQRCLNIAKELARQNQDVGFFIRDDKFAKRVIKKHGFSVYTVSDKLAAYETALLVQSASEVIVFDGIDIDNRIPEALNNTHKKIVVIDDSSNKRLDVDAVINGSFTGGQYRYGQGRKQTRYFLSPKYCVMNSEFDDYPVRPSENKVGTVLISLGSVDPKGFTVKVARALKNLTLPFDLVYVIGPGFRYLDELGAALNEHHSNFYFVENPSSLAPLLATADLAVVSGGRTCYEAARVGTPMVILPTVNHQELISNAFGKKAAAFPLSFAWALPVREFNTQLTERLDVATRNKKLRDQARLNAYKLIDGKGRERAAQIIMSCVGNSRMLQTTQGASRRQIA